MALSPIRVVAILEAYSITGPAKNLIEFASRAHQMRPGLPSAEVSILTFQRSRTDAPNAFITGATEHGVPVDVIRERRAFDRRVLPRLLALIEDRQPHIIQSHNVKSHFLVRWTGLHRRYRWIAFHHGYTATDAKMLVYNQLNRWSLRAAHRVVTVCRPFSLELQRGGVPAERIAIQHNMVDGFVPAAPERVVALRRRLGVPARAAVVLCAGRFSREKGHTDLIEAIHKLARRRPPPAPFRIVLVGDGPERPRIARMCAELALGGAVILPGHEPDLAPYYSMADIVVLPSHSEGSPNVLLEAMAAGVPVVATSVGGIPEIVAHQETALLVEKYDTEALSNAIGRLLDDDGLRARLAVAAQQAVAAYQPESYCRSLLRIYEQTIVSEKEVPAQVS